MCGPHQVWPLRSECCGRGVPTKVVCAECMKMCCLGGKNSVVKGLSHCWWHHVPGGLASYSLINYHLHDQFSESGLGRGTCRLSSSL